MKFQDSSFDGLKVTVGTKSVTHAPTNGRSKSNMPHQLFQSWGHKKYHCIVINLGVVTSRTCFKVHYCLESVFNPSINRHFRR